MAKEILTAAGTLACKFSSKSMKKEKDPSKVGQEPWTGQNWTDLRPSSINLLHAY
jgi:hypothetical protein